MQYRAKGFVGWVFMRSLPITTVQKQSSITRPEARCFSPLTSAFAIVVLVPALLLRLRVTVRGERLITNSSKSQSFDREPVMRIAQIGNHYPGAITRDCGNHSSDCHYYEMVGLTPIGVVQRIGGP